MKKEYRLLFRFIEGKLKFNDFIVKAFKNTNKNLIEVKFSKIPQLNRSHEKTHFDAWAKYKIVAKYYIEDGVPATAPVYEDLIRYIKEKNLDGEGFIKIYRKVVSAPKKLGLDLNGSDLTQFKILNRDFKTEEELENYEIARRLRNI